MAKKLTIGERTFKSQKEAEQFFYDIRDKYWESKTNIEKSEDFLLLKELYEQYCAVTNWTMKGILSYFAVRNIARSTGSQWGTTQGFAVIFDNGKEEEFSVRKALKAIADSQASKG